MFVDNAIVVARWPRQEPVGRNWGDKLNPELIHRLSGQPVAHVDDVLGWGDRPVHRVIGSSLAGMTPNDVVWGTGFLDAVTEPTAVAALIRAVRGPLSRDRLLALGIACPAVYGDPALLYPLFHRPRISEAYDFGIIQHVREQGAVAPPRFPAGARVLAIDITGDTAEVADKILSCRIIVSSSLHGLICAHAYGRPAHWLKASDLPLGDDFKFRDYFASIGLPDATPATTGADGLFAAPAPAPIPRAKPIDAEALIDSCPFASPERRRIFLQRRKRMIDEGCRGILFEDQ